MNHDDLSWDILKNGFCSFKFLSKTQTFCRNEYNVTGLCSRQACPITNSQYATVREEKGVLYLYSKVVEKSHFPSKQWKKTKLSRNFQKAMEQIEMQLLYWPGYYKHKCRQRFAKYTQVLSRMRKIKLHNTRELIPIQRKIETREKRREVKALKAARIEDTIERELIQRLEQGVYGDLYSIKQKSSSVLGEDDDDEREMEEDDEFELEGRDYENDIETEFIPEWDFHESEEDLTDVEDLKHDVRNICQTSVFQETQLPNSSDENEYKTLSTSKESNKKKRRKKISRVEIEFESEPSPQSLKNILK